MIATRRLAAILAVDVVGYSRLMGEDEAGTARSVSEHRDAARPIVAGLGGRIVKTMGDGLLLEFPSVVAAVDCAIAIQKLMRERNADAPPDKQILYRIGVNLGDVLIEGEDILGDGVNIAARLEGICDPGGILVSGSAFDHVRGKVDANFIDLGEKELKNIARPVRAYSVEAGAPLSRCPRHRSNPRRQRGMRRQPCCWLPSAFSGSRSRSAPGICSAEPARAGRDKPSRARRLERRRADRARPSLHRGAAFQKPLRGSSPGLFRRRHHRQSHHRLVARRP